MRRGYIHTAETLFKKVRKVKSGCWNFTGPICKKLGYGKVGYKGTVINAHRLAWVLSMGPIDSSKIFVCHKCDNRKCINPDHLFLGTALDNTLDMVRKGRHGGGGGLKGVLSICKKGHPFKDQNPIKTSKGYKTCRICHNQRRMKYYFNNKIRHQQPTNTMNRKHIEAQYLKIIAKFQPVDLFLFLPAIAGFVLTIIL